MKTIRIYLMVIFIAFYCNLNNAFSQGTSGYYKPLFPNQTSGNGDYVGWDGTQTIPLMIRTQAKYRIDFYTDSIFRATIDSLTGFVGIGRHFVSAVPAYLLDVDTGDINSFFSKSDGNNNNYGIAISRLFS